MAPASKRIVRRTDASVGALLHPLPLLSSIYAARGVEDVSQLSRELSGLLPPARMKGIDVASQLLAEAIVSGKRLLIVGDFDADGATSCALAVLALRAMGAAWVDFLVPNRFEYGYGLTPEIVALAAHYSPDIIVTVDNGIASIAGVAAAKASGMQVIVTDHHLPGDALPDADAIVNPNQRGCDFPSKALAGVGVIFYVLLATRAVLRDTGFFNDRPAPNLAEYLDLVALGTVADVVPLDANNRLLVHQGLLRIRAGRCRPGISALLQVAGKSPQRAVASDIGFAIGPRLNAAGRLDDMSIGIACLLENDLQRALAMAMQLDAFNRDRRAIEASMQREAETALQGVVNDGQMGYSVCLFDERWHQGVIGILASRLKERFHRPTLIFAPADKGEIKGSGRSIPGFHLRDALDEVATTHPGLLTKFGGHAMAAGLSLEAEKFEVFRDAFERVAQRLLTEDDLQATIHTDGELPLEYLQLDTAWALREGGPWGQGFPEPRFDGEFILVSQRIVGDKHLKCVLSPAQDVSSIVDGIAFNIDPEQWPAPEGVTVRLAYSLDVNHFRGRDSLQLLIEHIEVVAGT
ncbi:MAG TPA: single-stranded-DNA-specific exonuclease RecJ [Pseudomonadales bacterium]|nr:single-stranded-DNA-specific exonuclease RecJ [Pseudomonadales bacterium]